MGTDWLHDAVLYEIYPQSFADSDGDGVGDLRGVIARLDHIESLGVDTVWFNPCFASPFVDAGYDVADYLRIAPRYGTNEDMVELVAGRQRGIRVLLDLVAGHTSIEHAGSRRELHAAGPARGRSLHLVRPSADRRGRRPPGHPGLGAVAGAPPGVVPQELLRQAARAQLRLASARGGRAVAGRGRRAGPRRNVQALKDIMALLARPRRGRVPHRHGVLAHEGRATAERGGGDGGPVARDPRVAGRDLSGRRDHPRGHRPRTGDRRPSTPTSSW